MANFTAIPPTKSAATSEDLATDQFDLVTIAADALAGSEKVLINVKVGSTYVTATLSDGSIAQLDLEHPVLPLECGPTYQFVKDVTVADCGVYYSTKDH